MYFSNKIYGNNFINQHSKLLWFDIAKMLIAVLENKFIVSFIIIFLNCNQHLAISRHDSFRVRLMTAV